MQDIIPRDLLRQDKINEFLVWLRGLPLDAEDKKQLLRYWADALIIKVTADMIDKAGLTRR